MVTTRLMTAEELEQMPEDDYQYELVRGELIRMSPPNVLHGRFVMLLGTFVNGFVLEHDLGWVGTESGFRIERGPDTVRSPDLYFIRADRVPSEEAAQHFGDLAPDLTVEVRSPSDSMSNLLKKADEYLAAGTRLVWIFDQNHKTVHVKSADGTTRTLTADDELDGGDVLPGFRLSLRLLFGKK
jgi:Uma2 family endonuclease